MNFAEPGKVNGSNFCAYSNPINYSCCSSLEEKVLTSSGRKKTSCVFSVFKTVQ